MEPSELTPLGRKFLSYIEFDGDEKMVCEIRKHPFGLLLTWLVGLFIAVSVLLVTVGALYIFTGDRFNVGFSLDKARPVIAIIGFLVVILVLIATGISAWLYQHNLVLVTSQKIAEVTYVSIFNRKITQLDLGDIQDVAVTQRGLFPRVFGYGTLLIETAGEHENVLFTYAPFPYQCAKHIVGARENRRGNSNRPGIGMSGSNATATTPPMPTPPEPPAAPTE